MLIIDERDHVTNLCKFLQKFLFFHTNLIKKSRRIFLESGSHGGCNEKTKYKIVNFLSRLNILKSKKGKKRLKTAGEKSMEM